MGSASSIAADVTPDQIKALAQSRFQELDVDKSGFLEKNELIVVADWIMATFGTKLGADLDAVRSNLLERLDLNKDGKLDLVEFENLFIDMLNRTILLERAKTKFKEFDVDNNGAIEEKEIKEVVKWVMQIFPAESATSYEAELLKKIDANKDGKINTLEFFNLFEDVMARMAIVNKAKEKFIELDADKSGALEKGEIVNLIEWVCSHYYEKTEDEKKAFVESLMNKIDVNKDGKIDLQEFSELFAEMLEKVEAVAAATKKFHQLDVNGSGYLEKDELVPLLEKWASKNSGGTDLLQDLMQSLDVNKDGKVDLAEFAEMFSKLAMR